MPRHLISIHDLTRDQVSDLFVAAADVLETGLDNIGAVFHPGTVLLR